MTDLALVYSWVLYVGPMEVRKWTPRSQAALASAALFENVNSGKTTFAKMAREGTS